MSSTGSGRHAVSVGKDAPMAVSVGKDARVAGEPSVGELTKKASESFSVLIRSEIELAKVEVSAMVKKIGIGAVFFLVAGIIMVFSLTFGFIGLAEGLHLVGMARWLAYVTVFGLLILVAIVAALVGWLLVKKTRKPERTLTTVKDTADWAKHPTRTS